MEACAVSYDYFDYQESGVCASLHRCLEMIERHGPRLMAQGGGACSTQHRCRRTYVPPISEEKKKQIVDDYLAQPQTLVKMGEKWGVSYTLVGNVLRANGVRMSRWKHRDRGPYKTNHRGQE